MKTHLIVYQLQRVIDPISGCYQRLFSKWNHCAIQVDQIVLHCYDDLFVPRWVEIEADLRLPYPRESFYVGESNHTLKEIREFTNGLQNMSKMDYIYRYLSPLSGFRFPKKHNDCIHKCSLTLNYMFGYPKVITSTPDKLLAYIKECNGRSSSDY